MRCDYCLFHDREIGVCRRYAPSPSEISSNRENLSDLPENIIGLWPLVMDEDWCGEFKPKEMN